MFTVVKLVQPLNTDLVYKVKVTLSGIFTVVRLVQPSNVKQDIEVTPSGITTLVKLVQSLNASPAITFVAGLILHEVILVSFASIKTKYGLLSLPRYFALSNSLNFKLVQSLKLPKLTSVTLSGMFTLVKLVQPSNTEYQIEETPSGMLTVVKFTQLANALLLIVVTLPGMLTLIRLVQFSNARPVIIARPVARLKSRLTFASPLLLSAAAIADIVSLVIGPTTAMSCGPSPDKAPIAEVTVSDVIIHFA